VIKLEISPAGSWKGFNVAEFLLGRKRMIVTLIATGLGYWLTDSQLIAALSGGLFEIAFGIVRFYTARVKL